MPNHLLKEWLSVLVSRIDVDMETKAIEIHVSLPNSMLKTVFSSEKTMRLITTSGSSSGYETHPLASDALVALVNCQFLKVSNQICYDCQRRYVA